ncbi:response regulator [Stieleria sp. JC731]|uniref:response regulator n=1 Tax=Pirellulaceae TaxID=2691357 RepID=UPI001E2DBA2F|nr:response regulator [Stieleria sp. JC731]MCC9599640.1 response regulator [Stieleria sp. JC731]
MSDLKILLVDDDPVTRSMLKHTLKANGYRTDDASDGHAALEKLSEQSFQIVISDWNMPRMDGLALCEQIRKHDSEGYIYTILLTSNNAMEDRVTGLRSGADDFIGKPFNKDELLERVAAGERVLSLETREALIFALAKLAESRDTDTGLHLERVQRYARFLTQELIADPEFVDIIDEEFIQLVYQTSPLHDIGKVGIPDSVLLHPGKLTPEQFEVMQSHTIIGAECLEGAIAKSPNAKFLHMAHDIARSHHEKFDGSGYPDGLVGDQIPLAARIVAIADVYDALRSRRVYKEAFSHEKAMQIICGDSGSHFDPRLVEAFERIAQQFAAIASRFAEPDEASEPVDIAEKPDEVTIENRKDLGLQLLGT